MLQIPHAHIFTLKPYLKLLDFHKILYLAYGHVILSYIQMFLKSKN